MVYIFATMRLDPFITDLLFDNDCVILPEFGGLVANYRSARLNVISHVIQPPSKHVGFNPSLKYNDGLLANYMSSTLGIHYKEAALQVAQTIQEFQQLLSREGRFSIDRIGVFYKDRSGQVQFIPEEQENFLMASHGLRPLQLKLVGGVLNDNTDTAKVIEMDTRPNMRRWKVAAAIALPLMLAGSWVLGSRVGSHGEMSFASINPFKEARKGSVYAPIAETWDLHMAFQAPNQAYLFNDTILSRIDFVNGVVDQEGIAVGSTDRLAVPIDSKPTPEETVAVKQRPTASVSSSEKQPVAHAPSAYTLIGGAFGVKENAQRLIKQFRDQGYNAQFAGMKGNLHLVAIGHYGSREEAEVAQSKVHGSGAKAWIRTNQ